MTVEDTSKQTSSGPSRSVRYRPLTEADNDAIMVLMRGEWFDDPEYRTDQNRTLAATIDMRLLFKMTTGGIIVEDDQANEVVGVITWHGPQLPTTRDQGLQEVAVAKALEAGDALDAESSRDLRQFDADMRRYQEVSRQHRMPDGIDPFDGSITLLLLKKGYHGLGIGRKLLEDAQAACKDAGSTRLYLDTDNELNYHFYERMGWTQYATWPYELTIFGKHYETTGMIYAKDL